MDTATETKAPPNEAAYEWRIRSSECGPSGEATLPAMLNLLQEAASLNAEELGFSKSDFAAEGENVSWVLTRMKVEMERYPAWEERVKIVTWPRDGRKITARRDFLVFGADGAAIGRATSEWMIIDLATRRIVPVPETVYALANKEREPAFGAGDGFSKLRWDCRETSGAAEFRARRGDIDMNGHVNNVRYAEWLLETLPEGASVREFEIVFKSETFAGERVLAEGVEVAPGEYIHRVGAPDGRDHVLARTRLHAHDAFTAATAQSVQSGCSLRQ